MLWHRCAKSRGIQCVEGKQRKSKKSLHIQQVDTGSGGKTTSSPKEKPAASRSSTIRSTTNSNNSYCMGQGRLIKFVLDKLSPTKTDDFS